MTFDTSQPRPQRSTGSARRSVGFTLIELLVTLAVLAVIAGIAVPGFADLMSRHRATTLANELVTALSMARSESVKRGTAARVCPGSTAACDGSWSDGWVVVTADGEMLRAWEAPEGGASITAPAAVTFEPLGNAQTSAELVSQVSGCAGSEARHLRVTPGGSISVTAVECGFEPNMDYEDKEDKEDKKDKKK